MANISIQDIAQAGVVGAGGAGFPTHVKLSGKADSVLINAAECEPLLHKDKEVLREYVDGVIGGTAVGMELVGAGRGVVARRRNENRKTNYLTCRPARNGRADEA